MAIRIGWSSKLMAPALAALWACLGCSFHGFETCKPNPQHQQQPACTCNCDINSQSPECLDPNNSCCYEPTGACKTSTTSTPAASSSAATSMAPANTDGVRANMLRCPAKDGDCNNGLSIVACQQFYERVQFTNFADTTADAPDAGHTPTLFIGPPGEVPYSFAFEQKQVPWTSLAKGQSQEVVNEIRANNSQGKDAPGLDPGAEQCNGSATFEIQLLRAISINADPNGVLDGIRFEGDLNAPYGLCTKGPTCG